jgi:hypothetical protein
VLNINIFVICALIELNTVLFKPFASLSAEKWYKNKNELMHSLIASAQAIMARGE